MELSEFYTVLENATTVEEDVFDIRFEEVVSLVEQEKFEQATPLITTILNEGTVDIRLVMYLFYANFLETGIGCLKDFFPAIMILLNEHWERISPLQTRDKHVLSSLTWFLSSIVKKIKRSEKLYKEKRADDFWNKSIQSLSPQDLNELKTIAHRLGKLLTQKLEEPSLNQYIMFITKWLDSLAHVVADEEDQPEEVATVSPPESPLPEEQSSDQKGPLQEVLASSEQMILLYKKLQLFEDLIEKQDFEKAALIADDITTTIKNFDPTLFFPKLFSRYFALTATHIDTLSDEWNNKTSLKWEALNRLYQTDIEGFIQW
jgi:hypothetical protein